MVTSLGHRENKAPTSLAFSLVVLAAIVPSWRLHEVVPGLASLKLPLLLLVLAIGALLAQGQFGGVLQAASRGVGRLLAVLFVWGIICGMLALVRGRALTFILFDFTPTVLLFLAVVAAVRTRQQFRTMIAANVLGAVVYCLHARFVAGTDNTGRPVGLAYYDANDAGLLAAAMVLVAAGLAHTARRSSARLLWVLCVLVLLKTVLWTVSRGAFLSLCVGLTYLLFSPVMSRSKRWLLVGAAVVLLPLAGGQRYIAQMRTILNPSADYNFSGTSPNGRGEVWKRGIGYLIENPVFGVGSRNFAAAEARSGYAQSQRALGRGFKTSVAHNSYVEIAVELGVVGLGLFSAILFFTIGSLHRWARESEQSAVNSTRRLGFYMVAAFAALAVGMMFLSAQYWAPFYVLVATCAALVGIRSNSAREGIVPGKRMRPRSAARPLGTAALASGFPQR